MAETTGIHKLPRVAITYCTQCRWMLRAAYFGQELLSTFSTAIGEVALIPATGGIFQVHLTYLSADGATEKQGAQAQHVLLWDRKAEGGFPETKILKQRLRNYIEPERNLGHSDGPSNKANKAQQEEAAPKAAATESPTSNVQASAECEDCK
ncbi:Rdx family-domain-containing protein [Elsinoe ampelina]|uniref:Rdx family-domain-containing protein n=1 Tax=Elsinoe ampelina TaxID=302913 RepID=A0A6A6GI76_9PEZI|nr:Rdx family-domain-containing protein [Elsinoe ampelina]